MFPFGKGRPRKPRATVENTPRIPQPASKGIAREDVGVLIDGVEWKLEIVRQARIHGQEAFWLCPRCGSARWHLYFNGEVGCRECLGLGYAHNRAAMRARKLRRKLGGLPNPLASLPSRPRHWRRDHWARALTKLIATESVLAARLGAMVERRSSKRDRRNSSRRT
jgi:hypothetical protein